MNEIRVNQVLSLLIKLNEMSMADFGHEYADFDLSGGVLFVDARTRPNRIAIETLLQSFMHLTVYVIGNTKMEIMFS